MKIQYNAANYNPETKQIEHLKSFQAIRRSWNPLPGIGWQTVYPVVFDSNSPEVIEFPSREAAVAYLEKWPGILFNEERTAGQPNPAFTDREEKIPSWEIVE